VSEYVREKVFFVAILGMAISASLFLFCRPLIGLPFPNISTKASLGGHLVRHLVITASLLAVVSLHLHKVDIPSDHVLRFVCLQLLLHAQAVFYTYYMTRFSGIQFYVGLFFFLQLLSALMLFFLIPFIYIPLFIFAALVVVPVVLGTLQSHDSIRTHTGSVSFVISRVMLVGTVAEALLMLSYQLYLGDATDQAALFVYFIIFLLSAVAAWNVWHYRLKGLGLMTMIACPAMLLPVIILMVNKDVQVSDVFISLIIAVPPTFSVAWGLKRYELFH